MTDHIQVDLVQPDLVKDAEYFYQLRRAVGRTSPTALLGTSGLAMSQRIESAQNFELSRQLSRHDYMIYNIEIMVLRFFVRLIPWLSVALIAKLVTIAKPDNFKPGPHLYELVALVLALSAAIFVAAKVFQIALWYLGSGAIRFINNISAESSLIVRIPNLISRIQNLISRISKPTLRH